MKMFRALNCYEFQSAVIVENHIEHMRDYFEAEICRQYKHFTTLHYRNKQRADIDENINIINGKAFLINRYDDIIVMHMRPRENKTAIRRLRPLPVMRVN